MQMLYSSDSFAVVQFEPPASVASETVALDATPMLTPTLTPATGRGGYEIVDKLARKQIYIQGALAQRFEQGVQELVRQEHTSEELDDYIAGFTGLAQYPVLLH